MTEILLKVALITINLTPNSPIVAINFLSVTFLPRCMVHDLLCPPFERRETYCFSLIFSSASASSQQSLSGP